MNAEPVHQPEEVLWSGRRSHWYFLWLWLLGLLVAAGLCFTIFNFRSELSPWMPWVYAVPALIFLMLVSYIAWQRGKRRYKVTSRRVISEYGRFVTDTNEIRIQDIRSINVSKSGLSGLFGIGKVEFSSAATDDADVIFYQIAGADRVRDLVRRLQS